MSDQGREDSFFTPDEWTAIVLALRHVLGESIAVGLIELNPLWRSALRKIRDGAAFDV